MNEQRTLHIFKTSCNKFSTIPLILNTLYNINVTPFYIPLWIFMFPSILEKFSNIYYASLSQTLISLFSWSKWTQIHGFYPLN